MSHHPKMEVLDVCDGVYNSTGTENISVFGKKGRPEGVALGDKVERYEAACLRDDSCLVLAGLEMRIREQEEDLAEL